MNTKKKTLLSTMIVLVMICCITLPVFVYGDEAEVDSKYSEYTYNYEGFRSGFCYSDSFFSGSANDLSPDLAKFAASLAILAYSLNGQGVIDCLTSSDLNYSVNPYNYDIKSTYEDNDRVAFCIAKKEITLGGKTYNAYIIPIRGTTKNFEWFSDFNLGNRKDGFHEGFKIAADEVLKRIHEEVNTENNIFLFTGHSRGAAVANIVAAKLTIDADLADAEHIFGYNFACPAVKLDIKEEISNIRNYINPGDAIPALPLEDWGYERYGININLPVNNDVFDNFKIRFRTEIGAEYKGLLSTDGYVAAIKTLAEKREEFNSPNNAFIFDMVACALSEQPKEEAFRIAKKYHNVHSFVVTSVTDILFNGVTGSIQSLIDKNYQENLEFLAEIDNAIEYTSGMDVQAFSAWKEMGSNATLCNRILDNLEITVESRADLVMASKVLTDDMNNISYFMTNLEKLIQVYFSADKNIGTLKDAVYHAHQPESYVLWTDSMYYGYKGWFREDAETIDPDSLKNITINNMSTIGSGCFVSNNSFKKVILGDNVRFLGSSAFADCTGMTKLTVSDSITVLGDRVFYNCTGLKELTIPVDYRCPRDTRYTFGGCSNIEEIYYTKGKTGIMPDVAAIPNNDESDYSCRAEYAAYKSLKKITFEEGVKRIGACSFSNYSSHGNFGSPCTVLETVCLPESLEEIGDAAFYGCERLTSIKLPKKLNELGSSCFHNCKSLNRSLEEMGLPAGLTKIPGGCFSGCTGMEEVSIPAGITSIGGSAFADCTGMTKLTVSDSITVLGDRVFYNCTGLKELTIPVDYRCPRDTQDTFSGCSNIEEIYYTKGKTGIMPDVAAIPNNDESDYSCRAEYAAYKSLKKITFEEGVKRIGACSFSNYSSHGNFGSPCTALETVCLPESLEEIGDAAFYGCESLKIYGTRDSFADSYANAKNIPFVALKYPVFGNIPASVKKGSSTELKITVTLNENDTTDQVEWGIIGNASVDTFIDDAGKLHVADDETADSITVTAKYDKYSNAVSIEIQEDIFSVKYYLDGGEKTGDYPDQFSSNTSIIGFSDPVKKHYTFKGWYLSESGDEMFEVGKVYNHDLDLYARWEESPHTLSEWAVTKEPTCTADGEKTRSCSECDYIEKEELNALGHNYETIEGTYRAPSCKEAGREADQKCSRCNDLIEGAVIKATGHECGQMIDAVPAQCEQGGVAAHYECSGCHKLFIKDGDNYVEKTAEELKLQATGHSYGDLIAKKEATCTEAGMKAHYKCSVCHEYFDADKKATTKDALTIASLDHDYGDLIAEAPADCKKDGVVAHYECSRCHALFVKNGETYTETTADQLKIPEGHVYDQEIATEQYLKTAATCVNPAVYFKSCKCGEAGIETFKYGAPDMEAHEWNNSWQTVEGKESTCIQEGQEYDTCKLNPEHIRYRDKVLLNHTIEKIDAVAATCTEAGNIEYWRCKECHNIFSDKDGKTKITEADVIVNASGHAWGAPTYVWVENNSMVTATRICANDNNHKETETAATTSEITKPATYTSAGEMTYKAHFENGAFEGQAKVVVIPKLEKKANTITAKVTKKTFTVKAAAVKKKAQTISPIKVTKAKGTVSYKVSGGNTKSKKALKLDTKKGKVTVAKKTKKGTYSIKVTVTAKGTAEYKAGNKTVTVTVKVN